AEAYFRVPVPEEGKVSAGKVVLDDGSVVVFAVDTVTPGDASEAEEAERDMFRQQMSALAGREDADTLLRELRRQMKVTVVEAQLERLPFALDHQDGRSPACAGLFLFPHVESVRRLRCGSMRLTGPAAAGRFSPQMSPGIRLSADASSLSLLRRPAGRGGACLRQARLRRGPGMCDCEAVRKKWAR